MHTLFPDPVAPATRRCGILARSATRGSPEMVFPSAMARRASDLRNSEDSRISRRYTVSRSLLAISTPTTDLPGTGAWIRMPSALMILARSSVSVTMRLTFTPDAGSTS